MEGKKRRGRRKRKKREDGQYLNADRKEQQVLPVDESGWEKGKEGHWRGNSSRVIAVVVYILRSTTVLH